MPGQFEGILDKLQSKLGKQTIKRASTINRPRPKKEVIEIQAINNFIKRNPKADGGSVNGSEQAAFRAKVEELMDDGYDFGEAVREAMRQGYQDGGKVKKPPKGFMYNKQGKLVKKLDVKIIKKIKKRFPNKKFDFKNNKYGVTKGDSDLDKIRNMDPNRQAVLKKKQKLNQNEELELKLGLQNIIKSKKKIYYKEQKIDIEVILPLVKQVKL